LANGRDGVLLSTLEGSNRDDYATDNTIASNVISGNVGMGVEIFRGTLNKVRENKIGTNKDGTDGVSNGQDGVQIFEGSGNTIGGVDDNAGNVISGNTRDGVVIFAGTRSAKDNHVQGNFIGTKAGGKEALPNRNGVKLIGISFDESVVVSANV